MEGFEPLLSVISRHIAPRGPVCLKKLAECPIFARQIDPEEKVPLLELDEESIALLNKDIIQCVIEYFITHRQSSLQEYLKGPNKKDKAQKIAQSNTMYARFWVHPWCTVSEVIRKEGIIWLFKHFEVIENVGERVPSYIGYFYELYDSVHFRRKARIYTPKHKEAHRDTIYNVSRLTVEDVFCRIHPLSDEMRLQMQSKMEAALKKLKSIKMQGIVVAIGAIGKKKGAKRHADLPAPADAQDAAEQIDRKTHFQKNLSAAHCTAPSYGEALKEIKIPYIKGVLAIQTIVKKVFQGVLPKRSLYVLHEKIDMYFRKPDLTLNELVSNVSIRTKEKIGPNEHRETQKLVNNVFDFIFNPYILYIQSTCLKYVQNGKERFFFYKPEYKSIKNRFADFYVKEYFRPADSCTKEGPKEDRNHPDTKYSGGIAEDSSANEFKMRVFPKGDKGFRVVFSDTAETYLKKALKKSRSSVTVMTKEIRRRSKKEIASTTPVGSRIFSSVITQSDMVERIEEFKKRHAEEFLQNKPLYILKVDVKNCFDSIRYDKLEELAIIDNVLSKKEFEVEVLRDYTAEGRRKIVKNVTYTNKKISPHEQIAKAQGKYHLRTFVSRTTITEEDIKSALREEVYDTHIVHNNSKYRKIKGLTQGCRHSTHLCSYYLGELDRRIMKDTEKTFAVRYVDDTLLLSHSIGELEQVVRRMEKVYREHGVFLNTEKCRMYLPVGADERSIQMEGGVLVSTHKEFFQWCGLLLNVRTLHPKITWNPAIIRTKKDAKWSGETSIERDVYTIENSIARMQKSFYFKKGNEHRVQNAFLYVRYAAEKTGRYLKKSMPKRVREEISEKVLEIILRNKMICSLLSEKKIITQFARYNRISD